MIFIKRSIGLLLSAGVASLLMVGCGTDGASDVGTVAPPANGDKVIITGTNADQVLASTVGGIGKISRMLNGIVDDLPGQGTTIPKIAEAAPGIDNGMAISGENISLSLASRDCSEGGSISVSGVSINGGSVKFNHCQERGVVLDGSAEVSISSGSYSARFTDLDAGFSTGSLHLSDAGVTVSGSNFDFAIASGSANIQGTSIEVKNFALNKQGSGVIVNSSIKAGCVGGWVDVTTTTPLTFNSSELFVGGALTIAGNNSDMQLMVNADGSMNAQLNGQSYANYGSASELPQYSTVCQ